MKARALARRDARESSLDETGPLLRAVFRRLPSWRFFCVTLFAASAARLPVLSASLSQSLAADSGGPQLSALWRQGL